MRTATFSVRAKDNKCKDGEPTRIDCDVDINNVKSICLYDGYVSNTHIRSTGWEIRFDLFEISEGAIVDKLFNIYILPDKNYNVRSFQRAANSAFSKLLNAKNEVSIKKSNDSSTYFLRLIYDIENIQNLMQLETLEPERRYVFRITGQNNFSTNKEEYNVYDDLYPVNTVIAPNEVFRFTFDLFNEDNTPLQSGDIIENRESEVPYNFIYRPIIHISSPMLFNGDRTYYQSENRGDILLSSFIDVITGETYRFSNPDSLNKVIYNMPMEFTNIVIYLLDSDLSFIPFDSKTDEFVVTLLIDFFK